MIQCKIDVLKVPTDKLYKGEKGTYLDFKITERKEPDQYGQTHTIYIQKEKGDEKIYIGSGKVVEFKTDPNPPESRPEGWGASTGVNGYGQAQGDNLPF